MRRWKTLQSDYIVKSPYGNIRKDACQLPNGNVIDAYYVKEYRDWVNTVVITPDLDIILVKQYRHGVQDFCYELPGGIVDDGESFEQAAMREALEETGYTSNESAIKLGTFAVNPAEQNNYIHSYLIQNAHLVTGQHLDENEELDVVRFSFQEMEHKIKRGEIKQLFTVNAFHIAKLHI
ncbi:NUDIX hydrolase [Pontibacillus litoralis]|uniref:DNA repair protein MutT n=1 Tax=Pontibacillus litoralis JSM 072002 TaxID=1385512 RepID=A0A0A5HMQ3_9BACI|nr:NUDIX hydrolase [Pontibacillus litoralis]KGX84897.1 DNA repair protein MutT [Pontibacillus litoralis JSM 072002]